MLAGLGNAEYYSERFDDAALHYAEALAIFERILPPGHAHRAVVSGNLGAARREQGRLAEALALGTRAVALARAAYGDRHQQVAVLETELAATLRDHGDAAQAVRSAEHALEVFVATESGPDSTGSARVELALALWDARDRERARTVAVAAEADLKRAGVAGEWGLKKLERWRTAVGSAAGARPRDPVDEDALHEGRASNAQ